MNRPLRDEREDEVVGDATSPLGARLATTLHLNRGLREDESPDPAHDSGAKSVGGGTKSVGGGTKSARSSATATRPATRAAHADGPRRAPFVVLVGGLLLAGLWALLALNTASAAAEVRQRALQDSNTTTQNAVEQLQLDIAAKEAPAALASAAARLGMVPDGNPAFLSVRPDGTVVVLGSPSPVRAPVVPTPTVAPTLSATAGAAATSEAAVAAAAAPPSPTAAVTTATPAAAAPTTGPTTQPTTSPSVVSTLPGGPR